MGFRVDAEGGSVSGLRVPGQLAKRPTAVVAGALMALCAGRRAA